MKMKMGNQEEYTVHHLKNLKKEYWIKVLNGLNLEMKINVS